MHWLLLLFLQTVIIFTAVILYTRLVGLRSFSKISSFDFAMTIAVGSGIASTVLSSSISLKKGLFFLFFLFFIQWLIAMMRKIFPSSSIFFDNEPILLMQDGKFLAQNMKKANITKGDIIAKLREANAIKTENIHAVVFETTGDISVLHGEKVDPLLLEGVRTDHPS